MRGQLALALVLLGCAEGRPGVVDAQLDQGLDMRLDLLSARECGACHAVQLRELHASRHHTAFTGARFQREWGLDHEPFCLPCHAPRVRDNPWEEAKAARAGVDCASCHVRDGAVRAVAVSGDAPHPSRADPAFGTAVSCAPCHQVDFPGQPGLPLQDTVAEWRAAGEPAGACQTCHMPRERGHHRHDWAGGHDRDFVASAMRIEAAWRDGELRLRIHNLGAGHAIPTGDMFRRLVVTAGHHRVELGRHLVHRADGWHPVRDDRIPAGGSRELVFETDRHAEWRIELASEPHPSPHDRLQASDRPRLIARGHGELVEDRAPEQ